MNIIVKTQPYEKMRYKTVGDWLFDKNGDLHIFVASMNNWKYEMLVARHEIDEALMCKDRGIKEEDVTAFDIDFEERREDGNIDEPGDSEYAPYRIPHKLATKAEKILAKHLRVSWSKYDSKVNSL